MNTLGDGPLEQQYKEKMLNIAKALDMYLNGEELGPDRSTGFVLLVFPFNSSDGRCNYISNGADRDDIVAMFKEQIRRFEAPFAT